MSTFDRDSFDPLSFDVPSGDTGRFGASLPGRMLPRARRGAGLVWLAFPRYFGLREGVSGGVGTLQGSAQLGEGHFATRDDAGSVTFPFPGRLTSIATGWSLLWYGSITAFHPDGDDSLISVPRTASWATMEAALQLRRDSMTSSLYAVVRDGVNTYSSSSNTGAIATGEKAQLYAVTYAQGVTTFYKDGVAVGSATITNALPNTGTQPGVVVSGGHTDPVEDGNVPTADCVMAAIFNRALTAGEIALIARDPAWLVEESVAPPAYIPPPVANFSASVTSGVAPLSVTFTDTSSNSPTSWAWDFTNNGSTDSTSQNPTHVYSAAGTYTVKLTATNTSGSDDEVKTDYITVSAAPPPAPVANFSASATSGTAPLTVNFTDTSTNSPTSWAWDFTNDGSTDSTSQNPTHVYSAAGTYTVKLTATNAGGSDVETKTAYITVSAPAAATGLVQILVDWDNDGDYDDANEDITDYVRSARWQVGFRKPFMSVADETDAEFELVNIDRRFSPENSASPLYGQMLPHRRVQVLNVTAEPSVVMYTGWIELIQPAPGERGKQTAMMSAIGAKRFLQDATLSLPLQLNARADEMIDKILSQVQMPPALGKAWVLGAAGYSELGTNTRLAEAQTMLEVGIATFAYVGDTWANGVTAYEAIRDLTDGERGRFFFDREGQAVFWNRQHLQLATSLAATLTNQQMTLTYRYGEQLINQVEVVVRPRSISATANEVVYRLDSPITLKAGEERTLNGEFAGDEGEEVSALDVSPPSGVDLELTGSAELGGFVVEAKRVNVTLRGGGGGGSVQTLVVRGRKLTAHRDETVTAADPISVALYGRRAMRIETGVLDNRDLADAIARHTLNLYNNASGDVVSLGIVNRDAQYKGWQRSLTVGSRVRIVEAQTVHDQDYFVVGEEHTMTEGLSLHATRYIVEKASRTKTWLLGVVGSSELGDTTTLGF